MDIPILKFIYIDIKIKNYKIKHKKIKINQMK